VPPTLAWVVALAPGDMEPGAHGRPEEKEAAARRGASGGSAPWPKALNDHGLDCPGAGTGRGTASSTGARHTGVQLAVNHWSRSGGWGWAIDQSTPKESATLMSRAGGPASMSPTGRAALRDRGIEVSSSGCPRADRRVSAWQTPARGPGGCRWTPATNGLGPGFSQQWFCGFSCLAIDDSEAKRGRPREALGGAQRESGGSGISSTQGHGCGFFCSERPADVRLDVKPTAACQKRLVTPARRVWWGRSVARTVDPRTEIIPANHLREIGTRKGQE